MQSTDWQSVGVDATWWSLIVDCMQAREAAHDSSAAQALSSAMQRSSIQALHGPGPTHVPLAFGGKVCCPQNCSVVFRLHPTFASSDHSAWRQLSHAAFPRSRDAPHSSSKVEEHRDCEDSAAAAHSSCATATAR